MINIKDLKLLKIVRYLIVECDYRIIYTKETNSDIFLESIDTEDPQIIQISFKKNIFHHSFDDEISETKKIVNRIRKKTLKLKLKTWVIFLNDIKIKPPSEDKNLQIFTLNHNLEKLKARFPKIESIWNDDPKDESMEKILKQIATHSNHQLKNIRKKYGKRKIDSNNIFVLQLIWLNFILFVLSSLITPSVNIKYYELIYSGFASTFETVFLHNQFWRLLISGFIGVNVFSVFVGIWLINYIGQFVSQMYGNIKYWSIVLITTVFSQFLASLLLPGALVIGLSGTTFGLMGAIIYFAHINRVVFVNVFWPRLKFYLLILFIPLILTGSSVALALSLIALSLGFLTAMMVESFYKKMISFWVSFSFLFTIGVGFSMTWTYFPKRYPSLELYGKEFYQGYSLIYNDGGAFQNKLCTYYQLDENECLKLKTS